MMKSLQKLETTIHRCLENMTNLRTENERLAREVDEAQHRISAVSDENHTADLKKQHVIDKLTELTQRIEHLHIDSISNE